MGSLWTTPGELCHHLAMELLQRPYFGNTLLAYSLAALVFVAVSWGFLLIRRLLVERLAELAGKTLTDLDDLAVEVLAMIRKPECYLLGLYVATRPLVFDAKVDAFMRSVVMLALAYRLVTMLQVLVAYGVRRSLAGQELDVARLAMARNLTYLINGVVWVLAALFVLSNLGFNITSMVAGLGIGGVAVALAAQAVLGDLFSAVAIFLDKPFEVGDFIIVNDRPGTVEQIGFKTTRVRALSGELLVFPNSTLTSSVIRNFKQMSERRVALKFGLLYSTPRALLAELPAVVRSLLEKERQLRFDRAHFMGLGESSLDFEVVYWVLDPDFNKHMDYQQRFLLELMDAVRSRGGDFAFPTRSVHVESLPAPKPA